MWSKVPETEDECKLFGVARWVPRMLVNLKYISKTDSHEN